MWNDKQTRATDRQPPLLAKPPNKPFYSDLATGFERFSRNVQRFFKNCLEIRGSRKVRQGIYGTRD